MPAGKEKLFDYYKNIQLVMNLSKLILVFPDKTQQMHLYKPIKIKTSGQGFKPDVNGFDNALALHSIRPKEQEFP